MSVLLTLHKVLPEIFDSPFNKPVDWQINSGEIWAITGPNGSGKSMLAEIICGKYVLLEGSVEYHFIKENSFKPEDYIQVINFNSVFSLADYRNVYYQLRFNNPEDEVAPFVAKLFPESLSDKPEQTRIFELLDIKKLMDRRLIQLSSGELRKFLIAKVLLQKPRILIFDNPFIGLDAESRIHLNEIFPRLIEIGVTLIFLNPTGGELPKGTTHVAEMSDCEITSASELKNYKSLQKKYSNCELPVIDWYILPKHHKTSYSEIVRMENIEISYEQKVICKNINWIVEKGDKWALLGPNGSGKSTLLSYICADNPRSYVRGLTLFENKRGSGESIWDIKQRIGFTSSELHLFYRKKATCIQVIESGLFDSVGLYRTTHGEEKQIAEYMMNCLSIENLKNKLFQEISSGEQRMVLFARAIIKNPELLVLDEPFQGMDTDNKNLCRQLLDSYCSQSGKTLIFVTHEREEIPDCVDRFFELKYTDF